MRKTVARLLRFLIVSILWFYPVMVRAQVTVHYGKPCDPTLWKHVYHPERLIVKSPCVTVTGTIVDATAPQKHHRKDGVRKEEDGDTHGWLQLDGGQEVYLNDGNLKAEGGNLVYEIVCYFKVKQEDAKAACKNFQNTVILPPVGSCVALTGTWVQDTNHEQWLEIHPVSSFKVISCKVPR